MDVKGHMMILIFIALVLSGCEKITVPTINISNDSVYSKNVSYEAVVVAKDLDTPWAIGFLPDGRLIFTQRNGKLSIIENNTVKLIAQLNVSEESESGLLGIAVDPDFEVNHHIYLYYTISDRNRVSRFTLNNNGLEDEFVLIDKIPNAQFHDGGRIKFGPDRYLYITTGDATTPSSAQDITSLAGKILRIKKDGSIPTDNPFDNQIYSYGHRNPQGLAWHPLTGELYASEHGPSGNDEINIIEKGKNYGWPIKECDDVSSEFTNPIRCFSEFTLAPSGITFFKDDLYVAGLRGTQLRKITFDSEGKILGEEELFSDLGRIRDAVEHNGSLYIATSNKDGRGIPKSNDDKIIRINVK